MVCENIIVCFFFSLFLSSNSIELFLAGGSTLADLHQALEDYLPVLLGLTKDGKIPFYVLLNRDLFVFYVF